MVDFHKRKAIVKANTGMIEGVYLDQIPPGSSGLKPGLVLIHHNWRQLYFVNERLGWNDEDYFRYAIERFGDLSILTP